MTLGCQQAPERQRAPAWQQSAAEGADLERLAQAPVLHVVLRILLLELLLHARKVVPVHRPAGLEPLLGLGKLNPLPLPAEPDTLQAPSWPGMGAVVGAM